MGVEYITLLLFLCLFGTFALGLPVSFALLGVSLVFTLIFWSVAGLGIAVTNFFQVITNEIFLAIPLFVFMATILQFSGIAADLYKVFYKWSGSLKGSLASATVLACTVIAAMTGVAGTGVITMGLIGVPEMQKYHYDKRIMVGCIPAGSSLGTLIPPSVGMIIIAGYAYLSVGKMLIGGLLPGLLMSVLFIGYITIRCMIEPRLGPSLPPEERATWKEKVVALRGVLFPVIIIFIVLGGIYTGAATPTEAAALGAVGTLLSAAFNRTLSWDRLKEAISNTIRLTSMVMWLIVGGAAFTSFISASGVVTYLSSLLLGLPLSGHTLLAMMLFICVIMGMFIDVIALILICTPVFFPVVTALGFDTLWFGLVFAVSLAIGLNSPPFGINLFYMKGVLPKDSDITMGDIYRGAMPFVFMQLIVLVFCFLFPQVTLFLPNQLN